MWQAKCNACLLVALLIAGVLPIGLATGPCCAVDPLPVAATDEHSGSCCAKPHGSDTVQSPMESQNDRPANRPCSRPCCAGQVIAHWRPAPLSRNWDVLVSIVAIGEIRIDARDVALDLEKPPRA